MKVYELAKELNLRSVELVDHFRKKCKVPVKNHMQSLSKEDIQKARNFFGKKSKTPSPKKKPSGVKKKPASAPQAAGSASESAGSVAKASGIIRRRVRPPDKIPPSSSKPSPRPALKEDAAEDKQQAGVTTQPSSASPTPPTVSQAGRHIRPGMVTSDPQDNLFRTQDEAPAPPAGEKKKLKKNILENQNSLFRATDFRKREVIFQPKKKRPLTGLSGKKNKITKPKSHKRVIKMHGHISCQNLSHQLGVKQKDLIKKMKQEGLWDKEREEQKEWDRESAALVASFFDFEVKDLSKTESEIRDSLTFGDLSAEKKIRPPVVTVMGHVNHGKTSLLDRLRKSRVVEKEAGGITQHIGAYSVPVGKSFVTFIDTPGHKAFTAMRTRGAKVTDIVVIVVAADDGVQPQTVEAISHAKSAGVPILVAINKVDVPDVDIEKTKKQMMEQGVVPEEWGGDSIFCSISAKKGQGLDQLLEHIQLLAEVHELKSNPARSAVGVVIESRMEKGRGPVMSLLVKDGTLKSTQTLMIGDKLGRVRQMTNDQGKSIQQALPGQPVEISGFNDLVSTGETFHAVKSEKEARRFLSEKKSLPAPPGDTKPELSIEDMLLKTHLNKTRQLNLILKADVEGSLEAIRHSIKELNTEEVKAEVIHCGLGPFNESDVLLAGAGKALLFGFNVPASEKIKIMVSQKGLSLHSHKVIYTLLEEVEKNMAALLDPEIKEHPGGRAEVLQVFEVSDLGSVAGSQVRQGKIASSHFVRLIRENEVLYEGRIQSLKRFKQSVKEVSEGQECGIGLSQYKDFKVGDRIESFTKTEIRRERL